MSRSVSINNKPQVTVANSSIDTNITNSNISTTASNKVYDGSAFVNQKGDTSGNTITCSQIKYTAADITALGSSTDISEWKAAYEQGMLTYIYQSDFTDEFPQQCYYTHKSLGNGNKCLKIIKSYTTQNSVKVIQSEVPSVVDWTFDDSVTGVLSITLGTITSPNPSNPIPVGQTVCSVSVANTGSGSITISLSGTNASLYRIKNTTDNQTGSSIAYDPSKSYTIEVASDFSGQDYTHSLSLTATNDLHGNTSSVNINTSGTYVAAVYSNKRALVSSTETGDLRNFLLSGSNQNPFANNNNFPSLTDEFSISFWLRMESTNSNQETAIGFSGQDTRNHVKILTTSGKIIFSIASESAVRLDYITDSAPFSGDTSWKHVVITKKSGSIDTDNDRFGDKYVHIWINGVEQAITPSILGSSFNDSDWASETPSELFLFGRSRSYGTSGTTFTAGHKQSDVQHIDELAFFSKELSDSEVGSVYNSGEAFNLTTLASSFNLQKYFRFGDHETDVDTLGSIKIYDEINDTVFFQEDSNASGSHTQGFIEHLSALNDPIYTPGTSDLSNLKYVRTGTIGGSGNFDTGIFKMPVSCKMQTDWSMSFWFNAGSSSPLSLGGNTGMYVNLGYQSSGYAAKHTYFSGHRLSGFLWSYRGSGAPTDIFINAMGESINNGSYIKLNSPSTFPIMDDGNWHHVAVTWDGTGSTSNVTNSTLLANVKLYVNGTQQAMAADSSINGDLPASQVLDTIQMGGVLLTGQEDKAFSFDELAFWNDYELTQSDVESLYNNGSPTNVLTTLSNQPERYIRFETSTLTFDTKSNSSPTDASANAYLTQGTH